MRRPREEGKLQRKKAKEDPDMKDDNEMVVVMCGSVDMNNKKSTDGAETKREKVRGWDDGNPG